MERLQSTYLQLLQSYPKLLTVCTALGALMLLNKVVRTLLFIYKNFLRRRRNLLKRYGENTWVFITGSSDGIGRAFAHAFAKQGFNILLCARTESKLQKVQDQLLQLNPKIQVRYIKADFSEANKLDFFDDLCEMLKAYDISVLVNNVGVDVLSPYHELSEQEIARLITINCFPIAMLNRRFIPRLLRRDRKSAIINVASLAGELPMALHNVYSASKAFDDYLSRALSYEYPELDIISLRPSQVSTPMTFHKSKDLLTIGPEECAEGLLKDLSYERTSNGPVTHKLQGILYSAIPERLFNYVFRNFIGPDFIQERKSAAERANKQE